MIRRSRDSWSCNKLSYHVLCKQYSLPLDMFEVCYNPNKIFTELFNKFDLKAGFHTCHLLRGRLSTKCMEKDKCPGKHPGMQKVLCLRKTPHEIATLGITETVKSLLCKQQSSTDANKCREGYLVI